MSRKTIIIIIIAAMLIVSAIGVWFYLAHIKNKNTPGTNAEDAINKIIDGAAKGVLPSLQTNPLGNKPDINPANRANPIKNIKTNPFE